MSTDDLIRDLEALTNPAAGRTVPGAQRPVDTAPKGWETGVKYEGESFTVYSLPQTEEIAQDPAAWRQMVEDLGLKVPDGYHVQLLEAKYDPAAWHRDKLGEDAVTRPVWRYKFRVFPDALSVLRIDTDTLLRDAMRRRRPPRTPPEVVDRALMVVYADAQIGKVGSGGGTKELAARIADRFDRLDDHVRDLKKVGRPANAAYWMDAGDGLENFDNVTSQAYTNDLTLTEQVRAYRRVVFEGVGRLATSFDRVVAAVCGSNHAVVRKGKDAVGPPTNDWGIEVLSQVADAYALNPDAYGHVSFAFPDKWRSTLALDVAGQIVGLAHGHDAPRSERVPDWWKGQAFGREPIGSARILLSGHWHHLRVQQLADGRLWIQAPTLDNGSDWWTGISGDKSEPGLLVVSVTEHGWDDLRIL